MSFLTTILLVSGIYLAEPPSETIEIQSEPKLHCDRDYDICLTKICTDPDPFEKKKCMDRCHQDLLECEKM